jgi:hypothetical protein
MSVISRRALVRFSTFALTAPIVSKISSSAGDAQSIDLLELQQRPSLNTDLFQYILDRHASSAVKLTADGHSPDAYRVIAEQWRLLARHLSNINFDAQCKAALQPMIASGRFSQVDKSLYIPSFDRVAVSLQSRGLVRSRNQLLADTGSLPDGDMTEIVRSFVMNGVSSACHATADTFKALGNHRRLLVPATFPRHSRMITTVRHIAWCGSTKQEQYQNCYDAMTMIGGIVFFGGAAACLAIPGCAETVAAASLGATISGAVATFGTLAAFVAWLIGRECTPILATNAMKQSGASA